MVVVAFVGTFVVVMVTVPDGLVALPSVEPEQELLLYNVTPLSRLSVNWMFTVASSLGLVVNTLGLDKVAGSPSPESIEPLPVPEPLPLLVPVPVCVCPPFATRSPVGVPVEGIAIPGISGMSGIDDVSTFGSLPESLVTSVSALDVGAVEDCAAGSVSDACDGRFASSWQAAKRKDANAS